MPSDWSASPSPTSTRECCSARAPQPRAWGALYAITPEIHPAALRGTGDGAAAGFGRIASVVAPLTVPFVLERGGASGEVIVFSRFTVAFVGAGAAAWLLPELRGQVLR